MACQAVKEKKSELKNDPYILDPRYIALTPNQRQTFKFYLSQDSSRSLTSWLSARAALEEKNKKKNIEMGGQPVMIDDGEGGFIAQVYKNGKIKD